MSNRLYAFVGAGQLRKPDDRIGNSTADSFISSVVLLAWCQERWKLW